MSNDPLDSFVVPNKQTPDLDSIPSMRAASAKPMDSRREPKLSARTTDTGSDTHDNPIKAEKRAPDRADKKPIAPPSTVKANATALPKPTTEPTTGLEEKQPPAEITKKELKKTMQAAKQAARQAEKRDRYRKSRGSRFALYLVFIVAAGFVLAIASNSMVQSMEELRDAQTSSTASATTAS